MTPLGIKRTCPHCSARFYDLNKRPASCPKCNHSYDPSVVMRARRARRAAPAGGEEDALVSHMAKAKAAVKPKSKKIESEDDIESIEVAGAGEGLEEIEDIDDLDAIEEIEDTADEEMDDDITLEDEDVAADEVLIDKVEEAEGYEEEEEKPAKKKRK